MKRYYITRQGGSWELHEDTDISLPAFPPGTFRLRTRQLPTTIELQQSSTSRRPGDDILISGLQSRLNALNAALEQRSQTADRLLGAAY